MLTQSGPSPWMELEMEDLEALLERAKGKLSEQDQRTLEALVNSLLYVTDLVEDERTTIRELRALLLGKKSEKTRQVLARAGVEKNEPASATEQPPSNAKQPADAENGEAGAKNKGHGRNGACEYRGAEKIVVSHPSLQPGDACPHDCQGKVYRAQPGLLVRVVGRSPLQGTVYALEKLRCNLCGEVFTAPAPEGVGEEKYDASAAAMIGLLKYGSGLPFYRLEGLQASLGLPLPASTQWDIVEEAAETLSPAFEELVREAAQGEVLHNDDTSMKILTLMKENEKRKSKNRSQRKGKGASKKNRTGIFTSGIVSTKEGKKLALFFTGRQHAGENLRDVLIRRNEGLGAPLQMCDALARNLPKELQVIVGNCLAHGRRRFVGAIESFPEPCRHVLETLGSVYRNDAIARERQLDPTERLAFHQAESGPIMEGLHCWFTEQFEAKQVEPNSGLGQAISYMLDHWEKLTLFLREPGAPLDNNIAYAARGISDAMPCPGLCRVAGTPAILARPQHAGFFTGAA